MAKKKTKEWKRILIICLSVLTILLIAAGIKIYEDVLAGNVNVQEGETTYLYYHTNKTFDENMALWKEEHALKNMDAFKRMVKWFGYESILKPGRYKVNSSTNNLTLLRTIGTGKQEPVNVTFRYAERQNDLAAFWGKQLETDSIKLVMLLNDHLLLDTLHLSSAQSISLFIPNTYNFYWNTSAEKLMERMIKEYHNFWDSTRLEKARRLQLVPTEVSTLASIIQKETAKGDEMPIVAGVYYNRLKRGMPLQADPTIIYALNDKSIRRVWGDMLDISSPYNTYRNKGLPPGPICVPSIQAIDAVLNMPKHQYIYFCAKEDFSGYHNFASSFAQHCVNARKYQREMNRRGIR